MYVKVLPGFIKQRTCLLLLLDNFICNHVEVQTKRAVWRCQSGLHPFVKAAVTIFRILHNKQTAFWYENWFIKNNAWVSLGHFWCSTGTFFSTSHITTWSHTAVQLLINSCMCFVVRSLIKARLQLIAGGYQRHLAVTWMWTHYCSNCAYSLIHKVPHFFTSLCPSGIYSGRYLVFHSVCLSPLFSLLRHSREETVSAGFLHGKNGEFKGQLHVTSLFYCTAITIVINAVKLERKEQGCSAQMSKANRWSEAMSGFWAGDLNVAFPPLAHLYWSVTIWIKVITHKCLHC